MIITIDGPAAAGKGTLAAALASKYNFAYFDTGMVYRAVGLEFLLKHQDPKDVDLAIKYASELTFPKMMELSKNPQFRSPENGQNASITSAYPGVRAALLQMQQDFGKNPVFADGTAANGAIYDGRDTGTVVCPEAEIKFFLTASLEERAKRRHKEYVDKGLDKTYDEIYNDIKARDLRDTTRANDPLRPADDAIMLDSTLMSIEDVVKQASKIVEDRLNRA